MTAQKTARKTRTTRRIVSSSTVKKRRIGPSLSLRCPRPPLPKTSWVNPRSPSVKAAKPHLSSILQTRPLNPNCGLLPKSLRRIRGVTNRHKHLERYRPPGHLRNAPSPPDIYTTPLRSTRDSRTTAHSDTWTAPVQTELIRLCYTERETADWLRRCVKNSRLSTGGRIFSAFIFIISVLKGIFQYGERQISDKALSELYTKVFNI